MAGGKGAGGLLGWGAGRRGDARPGPTRRRPAALLNQDPGYLHNANGEKIPRAKPDPSQTKRVYSFLLLYY